MIKLYLKYLYMYNLTKEINYLFYVYWSIMVPLILFRYLLCNVLFSMGYITKPYISTPGQTLSSPPPQNKNERVHSVISEPQLKIQFTQSSYKVTSYLDFQPFLKGFQSIREYLRDLTEDINDADYFPRIVFPYRTFQVTPLSNESTILKFFNTYACQANLYGCKSKLKLEQYRLEIQHVIKGFCAVYKKFLTAKIILTTILHRCRTHLELKEVMNITCMDITIPIPENKLHLKKIS